MGRLEKQKGIHLFIAMAQVVLTMRRDIEFLIVGDGSLKKELEQETKSLHLNQNVRFLGWRRDVPDLIATMDLFLITSEWEPFGIVLLEAMIMGVPIVGFDVGGVSEVVKNGETGLLIKQRDPTLLAKEVVGLLEDDEGRILMSQKCRERVHAYFDMKMISKRVEDLYDEVLQEYKTC